MKGLPQSRPSKASLEARGLATKPAKGKRNVKTKKVPDAKPGYSLYSTDSEDQTTSVSQGLDRCATLLTNILHSDSKDPRKKKVAESKQTIKARGRSVSTPSAKSVPSKGKASIKSKAIIIPTASHKDQGPSTLYNDRLAASTPLLNSVERKKQHDLLEREQELTRQIQQLKEHFELLQQQKSPQIQEQQRRSLQDSMLQELDEYQERESQNIMHQGSLNSSAPLHSVVQDEVITSPSSKGTPAARRSLDFNHSHDEEQSRKEPHMETVEQTQFQSSLAQPKSSEDSIGRPKKQVRVVSPELDEQYKLNSRSATKNVSFSINSSLPEHPEHESSVSSKSRMSFSPVAAENQVRTLQYLTRELREVIGRSDDLEVNRLLMEIDQTCSLLPYMYTPSNTSSSSSGHREHQDLHQLKLENAQLRRNLRIADEKNHEQEDLMQNYENMQRGQSSISFELAACRSENASLQKQLQEEKEAKKKLKKDLENLEKVVTDLKEDKKRFVRILDNKEQDHSKSRRSGQQEMLKLSNDIKRLKAEVESGKLSLEAAKKESVILNFSIKQKDTEIERLNELIRSLQQSAQRLWGGIQTYPPNILSKDGLMSRSDVIYNKHIGEQDHLRPLLTSTRSRDRQSPAVHTTAKSRDINTRATREHRHTGLDLDPPIIDDQPLARSIGRSFEGPQTKSPLISSGNFQGRNINQSPQMSPDGAVYFSPKASLGPGAWTAGEPMYLTPEHKNKSVELSSLSSGDEEEFQRDLESLDAEIARIQRSLRETAMKTSNS